MAMDQEKKIKTYTELAKLGTFRERFDYLSLKGTVAEETFGFDRYLNQKFYKSADWQRIRKQVILRDMGYDLGLHGYDIIGKIIVHHMNPIALRDLYNLTDFLLNPEFMICTSHNTHNAIHYGDESLLAADAPVERKPNDTCPWR